MKLSSLRVAVFDREKLSGEMQDEPKMGTYFKFYSSSSTYLTVKLNQIQLICFSSYLWLGIQCLYNSILLYVRFLKEIKDRLS